MIDEVIDSPDDTGVIAALDHFDQLDDIFDQLIDQENKPVKAFASAVGGMQNSYFFMGLRSLNKIGVL